MEKILIAAVSKNFIIGNKGKTPWYSKEEFKFFKNLTIGSPVIMGRKTLESIGTGLPGRVNIVLSRNKNYPAILNDGFLFHSLIEAYDYCERKKFDKVFIIGGGEIFQQSICDADKLILSKMNLETDGDVYFPEINNSLWKEISNEKFTDFTVHCYIRNPF